MSFDDILNEIHDVIDNPIPDTDRTEDKTQYVAFVLDSSGSMHRIRELAVDSFNEQLQTLKRETEGINTKVITTKFSSSPIREIGEVVPLDEVEELTDETYIPDGNTALFDAIGFTINKVVREYKEDDSDAAVLFVVITDGEENDSQEFRQADIKQMVADLEDKTDRWTFTFLGANQNPLETAVMGMNFSLSNTMDWLPDAQGMQKMSADISQGMTAYYDARKVGQTQTMNFFDPQVDDSQTGDASDDDSTTDNS